MNRRRALVALVLALAGCAGEPPPSGDEVARIGGEPLRWSEFEAYLERHAATPRGVEDEAVLAALFEQFIDERLLARLAADRGLVEPGGPADAALDALLAEEIEPAADPQAVAEYYAAHAERFERPERVRLRQLLLEGSEQAERAVAELRAGRSFADVAASAGAEAWAAAGELLEREDLPPAYVDLVFGLEPGEVTDPVAADYGFHVFQVLERLPAEHLALEAVAAEIGDALRRRRADEARDRLVRQARDRYDLKVFEPNLPFGIEQER